MGLLESSRIQLKNFLLFKKTDRTYAEIQRMQSPMNLILYNRYRILCQASLILLLSNLSIGFYYH